MAEKLYGLNKTTLIDYPGKVAATIFTRGCNLRCPYCHNPELINGPPSDEMLSRTEIVNYLKKRAGLLGGVCITGGEPLMHDDLGGLISEIHGFGLKVKLDTNGTLPEKLSRTDADYIAMDLKTSLTRYKELGFTGDDSELVGRLKESIRYIRESEIPHHFRTTVVPGLVGLEDIREFISMIEGENCYVLQGFRPGQTLDPSYAELRPPELQLLEEMKRLLDDAGIICTLRYNN